MMHYWYGPGGNFIMGNFWWMNLLSLLVNILFWAVVIYIGIRLFKHFKKAEDVGKEDGAMAILRERYAKGEIDAEEFKQKKANLE